MTIELGISIFLTNLNPITVGFALICALIAFIIKPGQGRNRDLEFVLNLALAGSAIPTGFALLVCAFKPDLLKHLEGACLNIAVAGIALLYISIKTIFVRT